MKISQRARNTAPSPTLGITARAKQLKAQGIDVVSFGAGEPDFDTPEPIKRAAIAALEAGDTKYTPSAGTEPLRAAICEKLRRDNGLSYQPNEVIVSCGAKHSLYNLMQAELERIAALAVEWDLIVVSDEIYEKLTYDGKQHTSIASLGDEIKVRTFTVNGFSKAYSMTGWRLGYAAGDKSVVAAMCRIQDQSTSNPTSFAQAGAVAALNGPQDAVAEMARAFEQRRNVIVDRLNAI